MNRKIGLDILYLAYCNTVIENIGNIWLDTRYYHLLRCHFLQCLFGWMCIRLKAHFHVCVPCASPQIRSLAFTCPSDLQRGNVFAWPDFLHGITGRVKTNPKSMFCTGEIIMIWIFVFVIASFVTNKSLKRVDGNLFKCTGLDRILIRTGQQFCIYLNDQKSCISKRSVLLVLSLLSLNARAFYVPSFFKI